MTLKVLRAIVGGYKLPVRYDISQKQWERANALMRLC